MLITVGRLGDSHDTGHIEYVGRGRGSVLGNPLPVIGRGRWTGEAAAWATVTAPYRAGLFDLISAYLTGEP